MPDRSNPAASLVPAVGLLDRRGGDPVPDAVLLVIPAMGMTPTEVIVAATATSVEIVGLDEPETIEAGKNAHLIVLEADPLVDITNTRRIADVYLEGSRLDRDPRRARLRDEP